MIHLGTYESKDLNTGRITPEDYFMNSYLEEVFESEHVRTSTKQLLTILDASYEDVDLNKAMKNQLWNLIEEQHNESIRLLPNYEELFNGKLVTRKKDPVDFESK